MRLDLLSFVLINFFRPSAKTIKIPKSTQSWKAMKKKYFNATKQRWCLKCQSDCLAQPSLIGLWLLSVSFKPNHLVFFSTDTTRIFFLLIPTMFFSRVLICCRDRFSFSPITFAFECGWRPKNAQTLFYSKNLFTYFYYLQCGIVLLVWALNGMEDQSFYLAPLPQTHKS